MTHRARAAVEPEHIDANQFERGLSRAQQLVQENPEQATAVLDDSLALWRGPAYEEFADGFAQAEAARLEELRLAGEELRVAASLQAGQVGEAVTRAQSLTVSHPLRERPVELLMRALHEDGP